MDSATLPITGPCPIDLDAIGFDRASKRAHCSHCDKAVHNLSNMSEAEAKTFLRSVAGQKVCISYARGSDGGIRFAQPTASATVVSISRLASRRSAMRPVAAAAAGLGLAAALAACTPVGEVKVDPSLANRPKVEQHDPRPLAGEAPIPEVVTPPPSEPVMAGMIEAVPVPDVVDGEIAVPEFVEGKMEVPEIDEPCDTPKPVTKQPESPKTASIELQDLGASK